MDTLVRPIFTELDAAQHELAAAAEALCATEFSNPLLWRENDRVYAAVSDDQVVGVANVTLWPDRSANLRYLAVDPAVRGAGIGSTMVKGVLAAAEVEGCQRVTLMALSPSSESAQQDRLERFYESHGFSMPEPDSIGWMVCKIES
jgi:GNAT superfamily N-acetyltransferase